MAAEGGSERLFFALWPSGPLRTAIRRSTRDVVRHAGGRPVAPTAYHVTLAFLGEQPSERLPAVMDAAASLGPLSGRLTLERIGWFERARVLWFGPERTPPPLARFVHSLRAVLADIGIESERRPFHAHLTLARKVSRTPPSVSVRAVGWPFAGFALVASELARGGSRYRVLAEWPAVALSGDTEEAMK